MARRTPTREGPVPPFGSWRRRRWLRSGRRSHRGHNSHDWDYWGRYRYLYRSDRGRNSRCLDCRGNYLSWRIRCFTSVRGWNSRAESWFSPLYDIRSDRSRLILRRGGPALRRLRFKMTRRGPRPGVSSRVHREHCRTANRNQAVGNLLIGSAFGHLSYYCMRRSLWLAVLFPLLEVVLRVLADGLTYLVPKIYFPNTVLWSILNVEVRK